MNILQETPQQKCLFESQHMSQEREKNETEFLNLKLWSDGRSKTISTFCRLLLNKQQTLLFCLLRVQTFGSKVHVQLSKDICCAGGVTSSVAL